MPARPAVVLVHGSFAGGWCWRRVADRLVAHGERVYAPTLTGLADRSHLLREDIDLSVHVQDIVNLIEWEGLDRVVLCGHSYGGVVISGVAEALAPRIAALVYLEAAVLDPGASLWDYFTPKQRARMDALTSGAYVEPSAAAALRVNEADHEWVDRLSTRHPRASYMEALPLTNQRADVDTNVYVYASGFASPTQRACAEEAERRGWRRVDLPYGHDLMIDAPSEVAAVLRETVDVATRVSRRSRWIRNSEWGA